MPLHLNLTELKTLRTLVSNEWDSLLNAFEHDELTENNGFYRAGNMVFSDLMEKIEEEIVYISD